MLKKILTNLFKKEAPISEAYVDLWYPILPPFYDEEIDMWVTGVRVCYQGRYFNSELINHDRENAWDFYKSLVKAEKPYRLPVDIGGTVAESVREWPKLQ